MALASLLTFRRIQRLFIVCIVVMALVIIAGHRNIDKEHVIKLDRKKIQKVAEESVQFDRRNVQKVAENTSVQLDRKNVQKVAEETSVQTSPFCAEPKHGQSVVSESKACHIPKINPFDPQAMKLVSKSVPLDCGRKERAKLQGGNLVITDPDVVAASYRVVLRPPGDDFNSMVGPWIGLKVEKNIAVEDEFIELKLKTNDSKEYTEFLLQAVSRPEINSRPKSKTKLDLNVLIIAIDTVSNAHAQRKLPQSFKFMKETLKAYIFSGHSVVGDGTTQQLGAMLSGKSEKEYPESRRRLSGAKQVDGWDWIFKYMKEKGYVTSYTEDPPGTGTFQYRLAGFRDPPTDYYGRNFFLEAFKHEHDSSEFCIGGQKLHNYHLNLARRLYEQYQDRHKFIFHFVGLLGHYNFNAIGKMDEDLRDFMIEFKEKRYLDNTVFILMGDHGWRFGDFRQSIQGKLEERLPLLAIAFPESFKKQYPNLAKNLETNTNRLTAWYDVYATFRHLLVYPNEPEHLKHGVSLFNEVPLQRTCPDAGIPMHWCPCVLWSEVNATHEHVQKAVLHALHHINDLYLKEPFAKDKCVNLELGSVSFAEVQIPDLAMLRFQKSADQDGRIPVFTDGTRLKDVCHYRLTFTTSPSNAVYEATVSYLHGNFVVDEGVSRINAYGDQPKCVAKVLPHLRKYCYCKAG